MLLLSPLDVAEEAGQWTIFLTGLIALLRWLYHTARDINNMQMMVKQMFENEIPHLTHGMRRVCSKLDIDYDDLDDH